MSDPSESEPSETKSIEQTEASDTSLDEKKRSQETITDRVKEAGLSFKEMIASVADKAKIVTEAKAHTLKDKSAENISPARRDARDIQSLGTTVQYIITLFEDTMSYIERQEHEQQERLLNGYKKLLEEQINVIRSRLDLVKRL